MDYVALVSTQSSLAVPNPLHNWESGEIHMLNDFWGNSVRQSHMALGDYTILSHCFSDITDMYLKTFYVSINWLHWD